ncbi:MAG: cysteine desulfurase family protein [Pseudomonadota bacterium]
MDHNGSTPLHPAARAAMLPFLDGAYGNPSSGHWAAETARDAIEKARAEVAALIGATPDEIVFTSGATEANNLALKGSLGARGPYHIVASRIEHDAVLRSVQAMKRYGVRVTLVPVDGDGIVDPDEVRRAIGKDTSLISTMTANNEIGTIQPIAEIAAIAREHGIPFHSDAAQAVGKIPIDVEAMGVDYLSLAGHKFGAPNGVGALYIRKGRRLTPLLHGGGQEKKRRAGTESALLSAGLGAAARAAMGKDTSGLRSLREAFWQGLTDRFGTRVVLNGHPTRRVPNTLSVSFPGQIGAEILASMPGVAATTGSACHAGCIDMSHVLIAMGKSVDIGLGTIRFSLGDGNTMDEVNEVLGLLENALG